MCPLRSHSCKPNAIWHEGRDAMHVAWHACAAWSHQVVRARMDVREGEEICISYLAEALPMAACREPCRTC